MADSIDVPAGTTDAAVSQAADRVGARSWGDDAAISGAATWLRAHVRGEPQAPPDPRMREWVDKIAAELRAMSGDPQWSSLFTTTSVSMATPAPPGARPPPLPPVDGGTADTQAPTVQAPAAGTPTPVQPAADNPAPPQQPVAGASAPTASDTSDDASGFVTIEDNDNDYDYDDDGDDDGDGGPKVVVTGTRAYFGRLSPGCLTLIAVVALVIGAAIVFVVVDTGGTSSTGTSPRTEPSAVIPPLAVGPNVVFDGCIGVNPQGSTTTLDVAFTVANPTPGTYAAVFGQTPSGSLRGTGSSAGGANPVVVPVTATMFGSYSQLSVTAPDGSPVQVGPLGMQLPLTLDASTDKPNGCEPAALKTPIPGAAVTGASIQAVGGFLATLAHDIASGNVGDELAKLNPVVVDRYGASQCRSWLSTLDDPTAAFTVKAVSGPYAYDYDSNGLSRMVFTTYYVDATRIVKGQPVDQVVHVAKSSSGSLSWFTACGTPVPGAK